MILVGLTGGIGSGKSTVSGLLAERGAAVIDADAVTRELQQPGQPLLAAIADRFGADVLDDEGALRRQVLADRVFSDAELVAALNALVHPAVVEEMNLRLAKAEADDATAVLDVPLAEELRRWPVQAVVVVDVPEDVAVARVVAQRGMREDDAWARVARQASREERLALATQVVDNQGTLDDLRRRVDELWAWMATLPPLEQPLQP